MSQPPGRRPASSERRAALELEPGEEAGLRGHHRARHRAPGAGREVSGITLDEGARADYQRALDAYEDAKVSGDAMTEPEDIRHVTQILDDGRYAIACVRARVAGEPLPTRRPPCFFDPRHGLSVADVDYAPSGGATPIRARLRPGRRAGHAPARTPTSGRSCRGRAGCPTGRAGPAYAPYAAGYFAAGAGMSLLFGGLLIGSMGGWGFGDGWATTVTVAATAGRRRCGDAGGRRRRLRRDGGGDAGGDFGGGDMGGFGDFGGGFDF